MKSLMTFVGILAFNLPNIAMSSDFSCPVNANVSNFTCSGTVKVKTLAELNSYANNFGVLAKKPTVAKNLQIDFNSDLTSDLVISTPCLIRIPTNVVMTSTANICLNGTKGIVIDENFKFTGKNLKLESKEEVIINKNAVIKAQDIKLLSIGLGDASKTYIRDGANIEAANLSIESFDKGFIGKNSIVKLTGVLGIYSLGDDEASVREGARVEAAKIEISSTEETRVAKLTTLVASEIILNGIKCTINKTAVITADDRLGNCFLTSTTNKAKFSINKNQGTNPLTVNFNASSVVDAKGFVWSFGDGETLNSLTPNVTHVYSRVGSFTATLKYATKDNYKGLKSAGAIQIDVKEAPISNPVVPVPPRGNLKYQTDGTFVYLRGYIRKGTHDIANAYYVIDDNQDNKIQIPNFYQNSLTSVEMNTYGRHKVTMTVIDVQGLTHSKSMNVYTDEDESAVYPYMRLDVDQSAARTIFFDLSWSFNPIAGEALKNFKIDFGDGQSAVLTDSAFITHTYAQAGTYLVRGTGSVNGNEDFDEYEIEVTDENTPIMNPIAGFEYQIHDYAGNVMFTDDRSGTPNGEIISYAWDFGDGTIGYGKNAVNFYAPGDYLVTLTVTDTAGLRSSQTQKITIVAEGDDIASMLDCWSDGSKHLGCEVVAFDKFNQITRVKLDWGDGTSENLIVPDFASTGFSIREHNYQNYGTYNVNLTIDTSRGQTKNISYEFIHRGEPLAAIQCSVNGALATCNTSGTSDPQNSQLSYHYSFGDGIETDGPDRVTHTYAQSGHYDIKLTVKNIYGKTSDAYASVKIEDTLPIFPPVASIQCSVNNLLVMCNALASYDPYGYLLEYSFIFNPDSIINNLNGIASYSYSDAGFHLVTLMVRNSKGLEAYSSIWIQTTTVPSNQAPEGNFDCDNYRPYTLRCFPLYANDSDGFITSFEYTYDDSYTDAKADASPSDHTFVDPGVKIVTFMITDNEGSKKTISRSYNVVGSQPPILASLECVSSSPHQLSCTSSAYDPDINDNISNYSWDMGDGNVVNGFLPTISNYTYQAAGNKIIKLIVTDQYGKESSRIIDAVVKVNIAPIANFNCSSNINNYMACNSTSEDTDGTILKTIWYLDDGARFEGSDISYLFQVGGIHQIKLVVEDNLGFKAEISKQINVMSNKLPTFDISVGYSYGHIPFEESFRVNNAVDLDGYITSYEWIYDNEIIGTSKNLDYIFDTVGVHEVTLRVKDNAGGVVEKKVSFSTSEESDPVIVADKEEGDLPLNVKFNGQSSSDSYGAITLYEWFVGGVKIGEGESFEHIFEDLDIDKVELKVTNRFGVKTSVEKIIKLNKPNIYLNMAAKFDLFSGDHLSIPLTYEYTGTKEDHIEFFLEGAPQGMHIDDASHSIVWSPSISLPMIFSFSLHATDGEASFSKKIVINTYPKTLVKELNITSGVTSYIIASHGSVLDGAELTFSEKNNSRNVGIYESKVGKQSIISFISTEPEKVNIKFKDEVLVDNFNSKGFNFGGSNDVNGYAPPVKEIFKCSTTPIGVEYFTEDKVISYSLNPLTVNGIDSLAYLSNNVDAYTKSLIIEALKDVNYFITAGGRKKIYFSEKRNTLPGETEGKTLGTAIDNFGIFIPVKWKLDYDTDAKRIDQIKLTLLHEFFHTKQINLSDCKLERHVNDLSMLEIVESAAEYYALSNSSKEARIVEMKKNFKDDDLLPWNLSQKFLARGAFMDKKPDVYSSNILWDLLLSSSTNHVSIEDFFIYLKDYENKGATGFKVIKDFASLKNIDIDKFLFSMNSMMTTPVNNNANYPLISVFKDPTVFNVWNRENYYSRVIKEDTAFTNSTPGNMEIKPFGGRRIFLNNFGRLKNLNYDEGILTFFRFKVLTSSENIKIRIVAISSEGYEGEIGYQYMRKISGGYEVGLYGSRSSSGEYGYVLDIINSGMVSESANLLAVESNVARYYFDLEYADHTLGSPSVIYLECVLKCNETGQFFVPYTIRDATHSSGKKKLWRGYAQRYTMFVTPLDNFQDIKSLLYTVKKIPGTIEQEAGW